MNVFKVEQKNGHFNGVARPGAWSKSGACRDQNVGEGRGTKMSRVVVLKKIDFFRAPREKIFIF